MAEQKSVNFRVVYLFSDEGYMKLEPHPPQTRQAKKGLKSQVLIHQKLLQHSV